jgi:hypothetical protein
MGGSLKGAVGSYARKKYGDNICVWWRDSQEVEIDINRDLNEMARTSNIFKLSQNANLKDVRCTSHFIKVSIDVNFNFLTIPPSNTNIVTIFLSSITANCAF